jgi:uncharacterized protein (DUF362 family)
LTDDIDYLITMPVPKIHNNTGVSLSFKNQWGCIPEPNDRLRMHPYFKHVILEVNKAIKTKMAIVDGKYGLDINGTTRKPGTFELVDGSERPWYSRSAWIRADAGFY